MDETTFRILDILARNLGNAISINELTSKIKHAYGTAYYKNIYDCIQKLKNQKILNLTENGKSIISSLNFNNYMLTDMLAEMELKRKNDFLEKRTAFQLFFSDLERTFGRGFYNIESISIIRPQKNAGLNRTECLFLMRAPMAETGASKISEKEREKDIRGEILSIYLNMQMLQKIHNIKLDCLILEKNDFLKLLKPNERNPLREMLADKIAFFNPQAFWARLRLAARDGILIKAETEEINPAKLTERDFIYNLGRLGYREIGTKIEQGEDMRPEIIIAAVLMRGSARRIEAIPILLAKNEINYNLLIFLCQKYGKLGRLMGLLEAFHKINKGTEAEYALEILRKIKTISEKADAKSIRQKMGLYDAD